MAVNAIDENGPIDVLDLEEVPDDSLVVMTGMMGAPTVVIERPPGSRGQLAAIEALSDHLGRRITHVTCIEIGGMNSTLPLIAAARTGLPLVDADGMGRAFPELQMVSPSMHDIAAAPMAIADEKGNAAIIEADSNLAAEAEARRICIDMGASAFIALYPMTGQELKRSMIGGTLELAHQAGADLLAAFQRGSSPIEAVTNRLDGRLLFTGKVLSVERRTEAGFAKGQLEVEGIDSHAGHKLSVAFQNENLVAWIDGAVAVSVPDLISIVHAENGYPITTEEVRYGQRVSLLGIPCPPQWRTDRGLQLVGPRVFGYDIDYRPIGQL
jgi:DUF917 family protein